jgi:aspartyl-tRNA(Asn)/glutamyl-tRNA(Gln) amidotransferase subunit B
LIEVRLHHAHLEEDAGKLTHHGDYSLVDLNRAGTPLIEIVSLPNMHSPAEAKAYATELYRLMTYAGVTHGDLYHGNMRFDVNISVAPKDATTLGTRTEVKNLNSFRSVERAVEYEARRHVDLIEHGEAVMQETRGWNEASGKTTSQRSKEEAQDYRYMPDPDIPPIVLTDDEINAIQADMPMLPPDYRSRWVSMQLDQSVIDALLSEQVFAQIITSVQSKYGDGKARRVAHWFSSAFPTGEERPDVSQIDREPTGYTELARMVEENEVSSTAAKEIFVEILTSDKLPWKIAEEKNLLQVSDEGVVAAIVDEVLADEANAKAVADIKNGNEKVIGFLVGQVMKKSAGKANPALAQKLIRERM